jgi:glycosyltransferase involved in cell wall biosynthesis
MHIAVNLRAYVHNGIGGLGTVVRVLLAGLVRKHKLTVFAREEEFENIWSFAPAAQLRPAARVETDIRPGEFDLLFCPLLVLEPPVPPIPCAVLIPDLQHEFFPEFFTPEILAWRRANYQDSADVADVVFTVSEHSKHTIATHLDVEPERIVVIDHGVEEEFDRPADAATLGAFEALGLASDYLLFPGAFWPHKNHINLLRAFRILVDAGWGDLELALTGEHHFGAERIRAEIDTLRLDRNVRILGFQPRPVLAEVYRRARALVFVSRFEGFGMPILEAFHAGTPVVCSRMESCVEVAGGAALLVDERDPADIAVGLERVLKDTELRPRLVDLGRVRMQRYSWEHAVQRVEQEFERILMEGGRPRGDRQTLRQRLEQQSRELERLTAEVLELRQRAVGGAAGRAVAAFRRAARGPR